ncbi:MAG TPA: sialate O-acetylesterase [Phycisphaerae bacterium]|nr:sialate O-acetylesterase [Phycisphaerae bacterium]
MHKRMLTSLLLTAGLLVAMDAPLAADVKLPNLFADHMVLQRDMPIVVWGKADPGEKVTVTLGKHTATTTAGKDGTWRVALDKTSAGGPHTLTVAGANRVEFKDVLVGEVWVCSGQSNMNMPIDWGIFGAWGSPECTAAYFFGVELRRELGVPVGLVKSAVGGTIIESWTRREALIQAVPDMKPAIERWDKRIAAFDEAAFQEKVAAWQKAAAKAKAEGKRPPRQPVPITQNNRIPASLYNGMIAPLVPFTMRGVIWYQGESNARNAYLYRTLFPAMIRDWRAQWAQGNFPFLFVQLANYRPQSDQPGESQWAELREAQLMALGEPNTAMAVIIDIGDAKDIHPKNKQGVGKRLSLGALKLAYGCDIVHSGPIYKSMKIEGAKVRLSFAHTDGGLKAAGGGPLKGFAVAGEDKKFVWADARIDGQTVVVTSGAVSKPVAARYAWADNPACNLTNASGLPASPFRTDDWPGLTAPKK